MLRLKAKQDKMGFTLVELSIVIIIIGFLIAGVAAGQSLLKQAQLNAIITENSEYSTAIHTFKATYGQFPGDFKNAYAYWGTACAPDADPTHCNGNGDGYVQYSGNPPAVGGVTMYVHEGHHAWQQLGLAHLINGSFSGMASPTDENGTAGGVDAPYSKYPKGIWAMSETRDVYGQASYANIQSKGSFIMVGAHMGGNPPVNPLLSPSEAQALDTKVDDGLPFSGGAFSGNGGCITGFGCSSSCTNGNNTFQLQVNSPECYMGFFYDIK